VIFRVLKIAARIVGAIALLFVLYFGVTFVQIWLRGHEHTTKSAQAILVFGTTEDNGTPSPELKARLEQALTLYKAGRAPWVVVTGGRRPGDVYTEAGVSATFLEDHGVSTSHVLQGGGSDTWQNVSSVIGALRRHHITTVITVTDPFHEYRAMVISSDQGLTPYPSPVRDSPTIKHQLWRFYLKETLEVGVGRIVGYHRLSEWTTTPVKVHHSSGS
jgi:uncharacterized SAM-binding protein YcdF (DUF218 family)